MNQHDRVEQLIDEHAAEAEHDQELTDALVETERVIGRLAFHVLQALDYEARQELVGYLDSLCRAVSKIERWS